MADEEDWFEDYAEGDDEAQIDEYDIQHPQMILTS
jgi:hypothetical protein